MKKVFKKYLNLLFCIIFITLSFSIVGLTNNNIFFGVYSIDNSSCYSLWLAMSDLWAKSLESNNIEIEIISTVDSIETCKLVSSNKIQMGIAMGDTAFNAYNGLNQFQGQEQQILSLFSICPAYEHILTLDPNIRYIEDLEWKKIGVGKPGGREQALVQLIIETTGLEYSDYPCCTEVEVLYFFSTEQAIQDLLDRKVDAIFLNTIYPCIDIQKASDLEPIYFVSLNDHTIQKIIKDYYYCRDSKIPIDTYRGQDYDISTIQINNEIVINKNIDENTVYLLVKTFFENIEELSNSYPVLKQITAEKSINTSIPLHPGAEKFYKEIGYEIKYLDTTTIPPGQKSDKISSQVEQEVMISYNKNILNF